MDIICTSYFNNTKFCSFTKEFIYVSQDSKIQSDYSDWFLNETA